jgi:uncharacterized membrane protein
VNERNQYNRQKALDRLGRQAASVLAVPAKISQRRSLMLEFANTIYVHRPIADVFNFLSDLENIPKWNYYVLEVTKISDGPIGIGTIYHQVRNTDEQDFRITSLEPNQSVAIKTLAQSSPDFEMRFNLHEEGDTSSVQAYGNSKPACLPCWKEWRQEISRQPWPKTSQDSGNS